MKLESGIELTAAAIDALLARKAELNLPDFQVRTLSDFLAAAAAQQMKLSDREVICDQAILILDQLYAHLSFKRARYGVDPVQRLRLLRARAATFATDLEFHSEVLRIFNELRDAHTLYGLPPPYRGAFAFLPFVVRHYTGDEGESHFVITQTLAGLEHPAFVPGTEITHWNGMPVTRAVERLAGSIAAGNAASKFARGLSRIAGRNLTYTLPPAEETVFVQYQGEHGSGILQLPWYVATGFPPGAMRASSSAICQPVADRAAMHAVLWREDWREKDALQRQEEQEAHQRQGLGVAPIFDSLYDAPESLRNDPDLASLLPKVFEFQHPAGLIVRRGITPNELIGPGPKPKRFGYLRIKTFEGDPGEIFAEGRRILSLMSKEAPHGLIVDVRGNPGGSIKGAESLLQLMTPRPIEPALFHFANTPLIQQMLADVERLSSPDLVEARQIRELQAELRPWKKVALTALAEGMQVTDGCPITPEYLANNVGQVYHGPVVLVIDANSYSATDMFAAGFQDHGIGDIIGVDENTGGGGASQWWHQDHLFERLALLPGLPVKPLPGGAAIAFAHLRASRRGPRAAQPLEDLGVARNISYSLTKKDLMDWGSDLVRYACGKLAEKPFYALAITKAEVRDGALHLSVRSERLVRLVCEINGTPQFSGSAAREELAVPLDGLPPDKLTSVVVKGYSWRDPSPERTSAELDLVAATRCTLPLTPAAATEGASA